jgi:hypothetical protein
VRLEVAGERYGRLVALRPDGTSGKGGRRWVFRCECGVEVVRVLAVVRFTAKHGRPACMSCGRRSGRTRSARRMSSGATDGRSGIDDSVEELDVLTELVHR